MANQRKTPFLLASAFSLMFISMIGFGSAVIYSMVRWQSTVPDAYTHPLAIDKAVADANTTLARLNNRTREFIEAGDREQADQLRAEMLALDKSLHGNFAMVKAEALDDAREIAEIEHLLVDWRSVRMQLVELIRQGHQDQALQLATGTGARIYRQLEANLDSVAVIAHRQVAIQSAAARSESSRLIHLAGWFLGGLAIFSMLTGISVIHRVASTLAHDKQTTKMLYESEQRLKLALAGADEGTWDLDVATGKLSFDSQWGDILGYGSEQERPHSFKEWAALIHDEDRDRVLKAMSDHVAGRTAEYKSEYRIRSRSGALKWVAGHGRAVRPDHNGMALRVVGITRDITANKAAEDRVWQLAHSDFLTGLPNRSLFYDRLQQSIAHAARHDQKLALLFLDLDEFKQVNDNFGHDTGDALLQEVAKRLRQNIRSEDTAARTGGDEFILILNDITHAGDAAVVAEKIVHSLSERFIICGSACNIGGSIGISIFPDDSDDMETLVSQADNAMYKAKEKGKNNYQFFSPPR